MHNLSDKELLERIAHLQKMLAEAIAEALERRAAATQAADGQGAHDGQ